MAKNRSIYRQFYLKLIFATSFFIVTLSFIFYGFTKATIYEDIYEELYKDAQLIYKVSVNSNVQDTGFGIITNSDVTVDLVTVNGLNSISFRKFSKNKNHYVELLYPFDISKKQFIKIVKNTNSSHKMLNKIIGNIFFLGLGGLIMVILYAFTVSRTLLYPIIQINNKLGNMNENFLTQIDKNNLPIEFYPLANSINALTNRIQTFVKYQKELFIGAAHELKTPLAVIKLKSEVTMRKKREPEKYEETFKLIIDEVNDMNVMITSILDIGRQEGAQFEKPIEIDIIGFLNEKIKNYKMLAEQEKVKLIYNTTIENFYTIIQPTLFNQIIQNFVQNAIKFTPKEYEVSINITHNDGYIKIDVVDQGIGIDENIDLFAPFKRVGNKSGAGLGLFLAKSAADALGAELILKNRSDGQSGAVATLILYSNPSCKL